MRFLNIWTSRSATSMRCFSVLNSKCASRRKDVHFFNISTSKSAPNPLCFFTLWCPHVLCATAPCAFWTCELPTVLRACGAFCILTSKPASRHSGVQLFSLIWPDGSAPAALASLLFEPPEPQKHSVPRLFSLFVHLHLLSSNSFSSSDLLSSSLLYSDSSHLCFSIYCRNFDFQTSFY